jgi:trehalose utilization protein
LLEGGILRNTKISVIVWNEFIHERRNPDASSVYPAGLHSVIAGALRQPSAQGGRGVPLDVTTATLDQPEHGLSEARLEACDVLIWWGDVAHDEVSDEVVNRIHRRVLEGMGIIVLHSGHASKIFRRLQGTSCAVNWRAADERERLWVVQPSHPIATGLGQQFELPSEETYGESFDIAQPDSTVFISWFEGGEVFRSGCCWERGYGRMFYFRPGHVASPTFHDANVQRVLANAVQWAAPRFRFADTGPRSTDVEAVGGGSSDHRTTGAAGVDPVQAGWRTSSAPAVANAVLTDIRTRNSAAAKMVNQENSRWHNESSPLFPTLMHHLQACDAAPTGRKASGGRFAREYEGAPAV